MSRSVRSVAATLLLPLSMLVIAGCKSQQATIITPPIEDVDHPTSGWGLRKLEPKDYPDMKIAWSDKSNLEKAIDKSIQFLRAPSSNRFYPSPNPGDTITHDQVMATLYDMKELIHQNISAEQFQQNLLTRYDVYTSVGYNDKGDVWFTGYYTPIYQGSFTPTAEFKYPVYSRPAGIESDPITGEVKGTYPTRQEYMQSGALRGHELMYFKKPIDPFIIQVQGSAKVITPDGKTVYLGYAGTNGREHTGLGMQLVNEGKIDKKHLSLPAVMAYFDQHPDELDRYVMKDDRFTFLKVYGPEEWPAGSLGVQVTAQRTMATDKSIFPRASICFINVPKPMTSGEVLPYQGFTLDQDTGGGIRAAGRADLYMGIGDAAGQQAGQEFAQGHLYYFFLKPELVNPGSFPQGAKSVANSRAKRPAKYTGTGKGLTPGSGAPTGSDEMFPGAVHK
ncbi:MAG: MltA domain-containing protein [Phycisphaerae bacterium]